MAFYNPSHFRIEDAPALHALMRAYPFATLMSGAPDPDISHLPLLLDTGNSGTVLRGHVARANPHWRAALDGIAAVAIFSGPQAYVSPQWYPGKRNDARVVPTWNYQVVHAHGRLRAIDDPVWLHRLVSDLTAMHESAFAEPWAVTDAPTDYIDKMLGAIVGFELVVTRLEGKWKLSQNKTPADRTGAIEGLAARDDAHSRAVSAAMKQP